jgi:UDP-GlcNAc3NAcA epimerase
MKFLSVVGARPHFPKAAVLSRVLRGRHQETLVHTGQHYDDLLSDVFFRELGLPAPDVNLGVGSGSHAFQTAGIMEGLEPLLVESAPDAVIVFGDTNSTLAGALVAAKLGIPVAHVEAGFRSYNRLMPEEVNRVVTDHLSRYLFAATAGAVASLAKEGLTAGVHLVGDIMLDALLLALPRVREAEAAVLARRGLRPGAYFLATVHRPSNTDDPAALGDVLRALGALDMPVVLPLHPRTAAAIASQGLVPPGGVCLTEPVGYIEMLALEKNARAVITDSGGVQREAYFLQVPCVTLREDSEWPELLAGGWNVLAGHDPERIIEAAARERPERPPEPFFGDGHAAAKIVETFERDPPNR